VSHADRTFSDGLRSADSDCLAISARIGDYRLDSDRLGEAQGAGSAAAARCSTGVSVYAAGGDKGADDSDDDSDNDSDAAAGGRSAASAAREGESAGGGVVVSEVALGASRWSTLFRV
jgi:hypothetical protein